MATTPDPPSLQRHATVPGGDGHPVMPIEHELGERGGDGDYDAGVGTHAEYDRIDVREVEHEE